MDKQILFRCSGVGALMTDPLTKKDKEAGVLSATAKTFVLETWLKNEYGYYEDVVTDELMKGNVCEQDSMALVQRVLGGEFRRRFGKTLQDDTLIGHPDIILNNEDYGEDVKTSANLRTFIEATPSTLYKAQCQGYMKLSGKNNFRLIYCLVKTPPEIMIEKEKRLFFKYGCDESNPDYLKSVAQINHNNEIIDSIPVEKRVKVFEFTRDEDYLNELYSRCEKAKEYYNKLSL